MLPLHQLAVCAYAARLCSLTYTSLVLYYRTLDQKHLLQRSAVPNANGLHHGSTEPLSGCGIALQSINYM